MTLEEQIQVESLLFLRKLDFKIKALDAALAVNNTDSVLETAEKIYQWLITDLNK